MDEKERAITIVNIFLSKKADLLKANGANAFENLYARTLEPVNNVEGYGCIDREYLQKLLDDSTSNRYAWEALKLIENTEKVNFEIKYTISKELPKKPTKRGVDPLKNKFRNMVIASAVNKAVQAGLPEYSKGNNTSNTACLIVSQSLEQYGVYLTLEAVIKIWIEIRDQLQSRKKH